MFSDLTNLGMKRTALQALGFYISYLVLIMAAASIIGVITGFVAGEEEAFGHGFRLGTLIAVCSSILLSFAVLKEKRLTSSFGLSALAIFAGFLALVGGGVLGLIIPAFFTTKSMKGKHTKN